MRHLISVIAVALLVLARPSLAAFSSLYAFGDGVCTTTNSPGGTIYYGKRYTNGRVWLEVLAQRQGLTYEQNKNWSFFGHYSPNLITNLNNFLAPADANTALFVVWVNNADFVFNITQYAPYTNSNIATWTNAINRSLSNHFTAIQLLYGKGARTLVMPNAVDLTKVPYYVNLSATNKSFIRQRIIDFNGAFATRLNQARATFPGLTIISPDAFAVFDNLVAHPFDYGLTNVLSGGQSIDALSNPALTDKSLNGPGANYIFWDYLDPTARAHVVLADVAQQLISPAQISEISSANGSNWLQIANVPVGRNGAVDVSPDCSNWSLVQSFNSTNVTQTIGVPASQPMGLYRLRFPFAWSWP